ncbi:MAG: nitroreductase [candidate division Zixibacteria bacterium]|nr:nitroreductase [candidate division Zixibacteria bacterium]
MDIKEAIARRRAYRSLAPVEITEELVRDLAECASLSASCFNNQPWRFVFVYDRQVLERMRAVMSKGNEWTFDASMIIVVLSKKEYDCVIRDRAYYLFDVGMATAFMILRATELGLVAHPIAGYSPKKTREVLGIPEDTDVVTLVNVGRHADTISSVLSETQVEAEARRPERLPLEEIAFLNRYPADER